MSNEGGEVKTIGATATTFGVGGAVIGGIPGAIVGSVIGLGAGIVLALKGNK